MISNPVGQLRVCYTPLASAIVDTPEASLIAYTIDSIQARNIFPQDLPAYQRTTVTARTNGVVYPFWRDWALAEPYEFLTPEPLHHWHKMFWDHDAKWAIQAVGASHIDFRFSIHQPTVRYRHFQEGISSLKQVTGRTHRDIQRYLIPVISGAISAKFVTALRALLDFRYSGQAQRFSQTSSLRVQTALKEFHESKLVILELKARIPKLEFMQSPIMQWTADITEHAHITLVKDPARSGNNHDFEIQICRSLDRLDHVRRFDLMTAMKDASVDFHLEDVEGDEGEISAFSLVHDPDLKTQTIKEASRCHKATAAG
ncbi:hypothetical protein F5051DRAFT_479866 [Lentinula edodes]|nr:hypothetical protein F5051DRAFT_479866 [Lentinula edodes]